MKICVVINAGSGNGDTESIRTRLENIFHTAGRPVCFISGENLADLQREVRQALDEPVSSVVVCGGDGTIHAVAELLAGTDIPLGIIPAGTLNHFAKDLGVPQQVEEAAAVVLGGRIARVDLGEVNGHLFLNNSSVGLYPRMLELRIQRPARGLKKWAVAAWALFQELRKNRKVSARVIVDGKEVVTRTPLIMVGNNEYLLSGFEATSRESLNRGVLAIYIVKPGGAARLTRLVWQILWGRAHRGDHMEMVRADRVTIDAKNLPLPVALDGEVERLTPPLEYRSRPAALAVLVPAP